MDKQKEMLLQHVTNADRDGPCLSRKLPPLGGGVDTRRRIEIDDQIFQMMERFGGLKTNKMGLLIR
jgi:hypothetical protein